MPDATTPVSLPSGELQLPHPIGDGPWNECLRDFKRTIEGGSLFVFGRGCFFSVQDPTQKIGDVSRAACELAFDEFTRNVGFELQRQALGLAPDSATKGACWHPCCARPAHHDGPCIDSNLQRLQPPEGCPDPLEPEILERLARHIVASVSVNPGMQVVMKHSFSPALWQPTFAVCIGSGQVHVMTLAFIGDPVIGDRPSSKSTPFILRLVTDDLLAASAQGHTRGPSKYSVQPAPTNAVTMSSHVTEFADEFLAKATGNLASSSEAAKDIPDVPGICSSLELEVLTPSCEIKEKPQLGCGQSNSLQLNAASPLVGNTLRSQGVKREVSVLADGLSVKAMTDALNNQASCSTPRSLVVRPDHCSVLKVSFEISQTASAPTPAATAGGLVLHAKSIGCSEQELDRPPTVLGVINRRMAFLRRRRTLHASTVLPAKPPLVDRGARMRDRISRSNQRASSKDSSTSESVCSA
mmetsp:Transcript_74179/g.143579  ORF Transcript_74179/g.143579 Transcript_74179/m.143579 type:complete len:469 (+) Transcript_74179:65-1471(+)